jgi:hypothetical protein
MEVLLDPGRPLEIDGAMQNVTIGVAGGIGAPPVPAVAGQNLGLGIGSVAFTPTTDATVTIYKPDGSQLTAFSCAAATGACGGNLLNLPATGTYGIVVRPATGAIGSMSATLSTELAGTLNVDGSPFALNLDRLGRNARLQFAGSAGQLLRISWTGTASVASYTTLNVIAPSGSTIGLTNVLSAGNGSYDIPQLPATGTYTLFVDPPAFVTLSATVRIAPR